MIDSSTISIEIVPPEYVQDIAEGARDVYAAVFTEPPWDESLEWANGFDDRIVEYATYPGSRFVVARHDGHIVGFSLGFDWDPDDHFEECVARDLGPHAEFWTEDCFHFLELALLSEYRRQGIGGRMHDTLLASVPHRTAILSTNRLGPPPAAALYINRGWRLLLQNWSCCPGASPIHVMGRILETQT